MLDHSSVPALVGVVVGGRFLVENQLGAGAMATVYRAVHVKLGRAFAVKVMHPWLLSSDKMRARFQREAELGARLRHANLAAVVDVGELAAGTPYLVMELADGIPLTKVIGGEPMPAARVLRLAKQLCDGLRHAHAVGITHRDFKPDNVIVERAGTEDELVRIVDFGLALGDDTFVVPQSSGLSTATRRLTSSGLVFGTPAYMSPEHACGLPIDARADVYSLGVTVFEMLTGTVPFEGDGRAVALANIIEVAPAMEVRVPYLDVDPLLEAFTRALMRKSLGSRVQSATAARSLLDVIERDRPAAARLLGVDLAPTRPKRTAMPPLR